MNAETIRRGVTFDAFNNIRWGIVTKEGLLKEPGGQMFIDEMLKFCDEKLKRYVEDVTELGMDTQIGEYDKTKHIIALKESIFYKFETIEKLEKCIAKLK